MKLKYRYILYLIFILFIVAGLFSCGDKGGGEDPGELVKEENKFYIDSFEYEVVKNESTVSNELSYTFSFDIVFSFNENSSIRDFVVRISGTQEKSFKFTIDYCNTENVTLSQSTAAYPYALLNYSAIKEVTSMKATVKLKISTIDLIDDINKFLKIDCYNNKGCEFVDYNELTNNGIFKMEYSDHSSTDIIHYAFNDFTESYEVVSVITKSKSFVIPDMYLNYPVKTIDAGAFKGALDIEELVLPSTLTYIPEGLLNGMSKLKSLTLPFIGEKIQDSGKSIQSFGYIFGNTDYTDSIRVKQVSKDINDTILESEYCLPKDLAKVVVTGDSAIPHGAFSNCTMLENVELTGKVEEISDSAFLNCTNLKDFRIPDTVKSIGKSAFENFASNTSLDYFKLSDNITTIGENAFLGCDAITFEIPKYFLETQSQNIYTDAGFSSISIPYGVASIKEETFKNFKLLKKISLPKSLKTIGKDAFDACDQIESVIYEGNIEEWSNITFADLKSNPLSYGKGNLYLNGVLTETPQFLVLTESMQQIRDYAFNGVKNIENVNIPNVKTIGKFAFANTPIQTIQFGDELLGIGESAFSDCPKIDVLEIPNSVESIGMNAFKNTNLIQLSVPFIGQNRLENKFMSCWFGGDSYLSNKLCLPTTLKEVTITDGTSVPAYAFFECSNIQVIHLANVITEIETHAFDSCTSLIEVNMSTIFSQLNSIGKQAFVNCTKIEKFIFSEKLKTIEEEAFSGCTSLKNLDFRCKGAVVKKNAFIDCISLEILELEDQISTFEEGVFKNCHALKTINLKNKITISKDLFSGCTNIKSFSTAFIGNEEREQDKYFAYFFGATSYLEGYDYVPSKLTTVEVTCETIPTNAFYSLKGLRIVQFVGSTIGLSAFEKCTSIEEVITEEPLTTIQANAFADCESLKYLSLPKTLKTVGIDAFNNTFNHTDVDKNVFYKGTIDEWAMIDFADNYANPMAFADGFYSEHNSASNRVKNLHFTSATTIKPYAFYGFSEVQSVELAEETKTIGAYAFANMSSLTQFQAGSSLTEIGLDAFKSDALLEEVLLNAQLNRISEFAFMGCAGLVTLKYNGTVNDWVKIVFENQTANPIYAQNVYMLDASGNYSLLRDVVLDETVTEISAYAFHSSSIQTLKFTKSVLKIGDYAFTNCSSLTEVVYAGTAEEYQQIENNTPFSNNVTISYLS